MKIGSRVKFIANLNEEDLATGYYPPIGTKGTIVNIEDGDPEVQWDEGTNSRDNTYWCNASDVEIIYDPDFGSCLRIKIYLANGHVPMAELEFANHSRITIEWANSKEREFYNKYISAYTLIDDTRVRKEMF